MKPLIAAIAISMSLAGPMGLAGRASAQNSMDRPYQIAAVTNVPANEALNHARVADAIALPIKLDAMKSEKTIAPSSASGQESIVNSLQAVAAKLVADHAPGSTEVLRTGAALDLMATVGSNGNAMEQQSVNIHVTYDARPVGGILNIRVELVPVFGGIGAAVRPTVSREFAQAIDNFDDDFIGQTITTLTGELAAELASK